MDNGQWSGLLAKMGLGWGLVFCHNLALSTKRKGKEDECGNFKGWPIPRVPGSS
jgi:hypothetical protein